MSIQLLCRTDDFGSARAANRAILEAADMEYVVRNVSCIACAPYIEEGAQQLKKYAHIDIGVHLTLNSEWNGVRWGALTDNEQITDDRGYFFQTQQELAGRKPDLGGILREYDAQLDRLTKLGLSVAYADSHMGPELWVSGLAEAIEDWTWKKGLISARYYYSSAKQEGPSFTDKDEDYLKGVRLWLKGLQQGKQYSYVTHPAKGCEELLLFYNEEIPAGVIAKQRNQEYMAVTAQSWINWKEELNIRPVCYTEAREQGDGLPLLKSMLNFEKKSKEK